MPPRANAKQFEALIDRRRRHGLDTLDEVGRGLKPCLPAAHPAYGDVANELAALLAPNRAPYTP